MAVEYPNAVLCLQEMSQLSPLSGLTVDHLPDEAWRFRELVQQIIDMQNRNTSSVADRAKLLYYDGTVLNLSPGLQLSESEQNTNVVFITSFSFHNQTLCCDPH